MLTVLRNTWALLLGMLLLMLGNGMQGTLLGIRGGIEEFSTFQMSVVMSCYFVGFLFGSTHGAGDDPPGRPCAGLCGARLDDLGGADPLRRGAGLDRLGGAAGADRVFLLGRLYHRRKLAEQRLDQRKPGPGAVAVPDRADAGHHRGAGAVELWRSHGTIILFIIPSVLVSLAFTPILLSVSQAPAFESTKPLSFRRLYRGFAAWAASGMFLLGGIFSAQFGMVSVWGIAGGSVGQAI